MDIQKEREAFEGVFPCSVGTALNEYGHYESKINQQDAMIQNISWVVWQAAIARMEVRINTLDEILLNQGEALAQAKAQAVPDGFVVVPKEPTKEMLIAGIKGKASPCNALAVYKAMIEAQEPAND